MVFVGFDDAGGDVEVDFAAGEGEADSLWGAGGGFDVVGVGEGADEFGVVGDEAVVAVEQADRNALDGVFKAR